MKHLFTFALSVLLAFAVYAQESVSATKGVTYGAGYNCRRRYTCS